MTIDYSTVTELAGDEISQEQLERLCHRYYWAGTYCAGKDVLEAACGTGPGLGYLSKLAASIKAGDYDENILKIAQNHYGNRIELKSFDAQDTPYADHSLDVVILFEAIYYLPSAEQFINECKRVLKKGGKILIVTANKDLYDFNPSPYSHTYYGVVELNELLTKHGFAVECFGYLSVEEISWRQKILRPIKKFVVDLGLMPKSMTGKKLLKRLVFGNMVKMPAEIEAETVPYAAPTPLPLSEPDDRNHKVIYCAATLL
ncbi:MAG: class I SAM-dependent methyltransferase [Anaerolineae bacterium]|nr:class I SAM-dependent methyltransferase [Anaerolineae bacterium]